MLLAVDSRFLAVALFEFRLVTVHHGAAVSLDIGYHFSPFDESRPKVIDLVHRPGGGRSEQGPANGSIGKPLPEPSRFNRDGFHRLGRLLRGSRLWNGRIVVHVVGSTAETAAHVGDEHLLHVVRAKRNQVRRLRFVGLLAREKLSKRLVPAGDKLPCLHKADKASRSRHRDKPGLHDSLVFAQGLKGA